MKTILFCQNNYAFGILEPIKNILIEKGYSYIWYIPKKLIDDFPYNSETFTTKISDLEYFNSDAIFVPGNEAPHYLRGLKVQIFHGLAGEKKGHFRIRHYFDLYLTQGPYFTRGFNKLKAKYKNFDVIQTGWPKLDIYNKNKSYFQKKKKKISEKYDIDKVLLYAPTFSPKLTSAPYLIENIKTLANNKKYLILIKFHPLMDEHWVDIYKNLSKNIENIIFKEENNIVEFLLISDLLISDTSSVIYEFLLLDKPVITFNNISKNISWENTNDYNLLTDLVISNLSKDPFAKYRKSIFKEMHPYNDGNSAKRMVEATESYIKKYGVPKKRKLSLLRQMKIHSIFGKSTK